MQGCVNERQVVLGASRLAPADVGRRVKTLDSLQNSPGTRWEGEPLPPPLPRFALWMLVAL